MIAVRLVPPRRYCSDRTCGGADCTTCYGAHAEVLLDVRVDGRPLADQLVGELLDAPDGAVVAGVAADDVRAALWRATGSASPPATSPTSRVDDDLLPF